MKKIITFSFCCIAIMAFSFSSFATDSGRDLSQKPTNFDNPYIVTTPGGESSGGTLSESFEDPTFPPPGWSVLSPDGGTGWNRQTAGTSPIPGWSGGTITTPPGGETAVAFCTWNTGGASSNDQWLVSPQVVGVQEGDILSFWLWFPFDSFADSIDILISTTSGTDPADFNVVVDQIALAVGSGDITWTYYSYVVTDYVAAGSDIYIAWREHVSDNFNDGSATCLDLVQVAPTGQTVPVSYAREDLDGDYVPDHLGEILTIQGTISSPNYNTGNFNYVINDGTAGITSIFFGYGGPEYNMGDVVQVTGEISQFRGLTQIEPANDSGVVFIGTGGTLPDITVLTLEEYFMDPESYEGELLGFVGLSAAGGGNPWPISGQDANFNLTDALGVDTIAMRIDKETDLDENPEPAWPKDIIGFGGQFTFDSPPNNGYQNLPRMYSEILPAGTIPVELTSFTAQVTDGIVQLNWSTSTELNNHGFEIERKSEGQFIAIGFIQGYGTTTEIQNYSFSDAYVKTGTYYYRLKQVDFSGLYEYSDVIEVEVLAPDVFALQQNYPNPFNPSTRITFNLAVESRVSLKLFDVLGQQVAELISSNLTAGIHDFDFNAAGINSGVYFYKIEATGIDGSAFTDVKKMILAK